MRCLSTLLLALAGLFLTACSSGRIKLPSGAVIAPPSQADQPTQVSESKQQSVLALPAGSTIQVSQTPATPQSPAGTTTVYSLSKDSQQTVQSSAQTISLSPTRKPDTTVAIHQADLAERRILLYAAIVCLIGGIALKALLSSWPGAAPTAWIASGILFAAWKFSEVPWWAALLAVGAYLAIAGGYKRGEVDEKTSK